MQVGIATFDTTVHFYSLQASQSQAQMLVMPDVEDVYSVSSASVVVPLQPSLDLVISCFSASRQSSKLAITELSHACNCKTGISSCQACMWTFCGNTQFLHRDASDTASLCIPLAEQLLQSVHTVK